MDFPGETFRVLMEFLSIGAKEKEMKACGDAAQRTRRLVLEKWEAING